MNNKNNLGQAIIASALSALTVVVPANGDASELPMQIADSFHFRNLGPFRVNGWVTDLAVPTNGLEHTATIYVASRGAGVWKTTNDGTKFELIFDEVGPIGDVSVAPADNNIVWVGTGGNEFSRSSHSGRGVFKSTDAGASWEHMGLTETQHIAQIIIHPTDSNIVYVAAMGSLFSSNTERGVFKTIDGGETWRKVLYINENVGVVDIALNSKEPDTLYAAAYDKRRTPSKYVAGGPGTGIYKTTDGGSSWNQLSGGLPTGDLGRIGLGIYPKNPEIIYAVIENTNLRPMTREEKKSARERGQQINHAYIGNEVYRSDDGGESWRRSHKKGVMVGSKAPYSFNQIFVDPNDELTVYVTAARTSYSNDGGQTWRDNKRGERSIFKNSFGDDRTFWIDPQNSDRLLLGNDAGVFISYDRGKTSRHFHNIPLSEIYGVGVDNADPYNVYVSLQDHVSFKGPANTWQGEVSQDYWVVVGKGDGQFNQVDSTGRYLYSTMQWCCMLRVDQLNGTRKDIHPTAPEDAASYRTPWTPVVQVSAHDDKTIYTGTQVVLRSRDRGDSWQEISPDLTYGTLVEDGGECAIHNDLQGHVTFCAVTGLAESRIVEGLIWAGTDDGRTYITRNGGEDWFETTSALADAGAPAEYWVTRVAPSKHDPSVAYVTKSGYKLDKFDPQIYKTEDYGLTWKNITGDLPESPVNVVYEDYVNPELLFLGNDLGVYATLDGGGSWIPIKGDMQTVSVKDLTIHERENDLIIGTYGRGIYITDIGLLREITDEMLNAPAHLFDIESNVIYYSEREKWPQSRLLGTNHLSTPNDPAGFAIVYHLAKSRNGSAKITIRSRDSGKRFTIEGPAQAGINRVQWNTRDIQGLEPGEFDITLSVAGRKFTKSARLKPPIGFPVGQVSAPLQE